jgi:hypothetical protein
MTKDTALDLIDQYCGHMRSRRDNDETLTGMRDRWPEDGSERKAMRWLGFIQGAAYVSGYFTLEELKEHSRTGTLTPTRK